LATLKRLLALEPKVIGPGHGDVVRDPIAYLTYYLKHRDERGQQILALLEMGSASTPQELVSRIYDSAINPEQLTAAEWMMQGHLNWFERQGLVVQDHGRYRKAGTS
jgi:glyoxylase-like metal-dependent hydrolase (beta-lactamase superfamily II)